MDHFTNAGLRFDVSDGGDPGGDPVVLLHGFPQSPSTFTAVLPGLHDSGLRTLVPTQRGYTRANRAPRRRDYRTSEVVGDVLALLDAAGLRRAHLVGHDWGGTQAWGMGGWHPGRVLSLTVLSTPHPRAMLRSMVQGDQALRSAYLALFQLPAVPEALVSATLTRFLRGSGLPQEYVTRYSTAMTEPGAVTGALNWYRGLPFSASPQVGPVTVPTTYVWGRSDFALGRAAAEATEHCVRGPFAFVELDGGHWLPETHPAAVAQAILDRVRSSA